MERESASKKGVELAIFNESLTVSSGTSMPLGCVKVEGRDGKRLFLLDLSLPPFSFLPLPFCLIGDMAVYFLLMRNILLMPPHYL